MTTSKYLIYCFHLLLLLLPSPAAAQPELCKDCPCLIRLGEQLAEKGDYVNAIRQYNAAKECDPNQTTELNRRIEALFQRIEGLRQEAVNAEQDALKQKAIAEKNLERAEKAERSAKAEAKRAEENARKAEQSAREAFRQKTISDSLLAVSNQLRAEAETEKNRAEAEAQRANNALQKLEKAFGDLADIYVQRAEDFILQLHYDSALIWAAEASALQVESRAPAMATLYLELAYFYNEAGQPDTAAAMTDSLLAWASQPATGGKPEIGNRKSESQPSNNPTIQQSNHQPSNHPAIQPSNNLTIQPSNNLSRDSLRTLLSTFDSTAFAALEKRYYPHMIPIPGGTFRMGSRKRGRDFRDERPVHEVTLSPFGMAETETTWWQYHLYCRASGQPLPQEPGWGRQGSLPVVNVSWEDAQGYIQWLNDRMPFTFRLPTEAEWEYAAGNGSRHTLYSWGDGPPSGKKGGNVADQTAKKQNPDWTIFEGYTDGFVYTAPVRSFDPNDLGLYDMTGNVWEWCQDWFSSYSSSPQTNPKGPDSGSRRVYRGGSWRDVPAYARVANRRYDVPGFRYFYLGFRLARPVE